MPPPEGVPPLEHFLFEGKAGYCQHFSGAMALLLRMGGVPARVATGFSPGGFRRRQGEWVVRDRDAHSWVEAWFDGIGWVTFDPTPSATPARSLIASINAPTQSAAERRRGRRRDRPAGPRATRPARAGELDQPGRGRDGARTSAATAGPRRGSTLAGGLALLAARGRRSCCGAAAPARGPARAGGPRDRRPRGRAAPCRAARSRRG